MSQKKCSLCKQKARYRIVARAPGNTRFCRNLCEDHFYRNVHNDTYTGGMRIVSCKEIHRPAAPRPSR